MSEFLHDVLKGLSSTPKYLLSKYLYDGQGDILFEKIMNSDEYYVTDCELEILQNRCDTIVEYIKSFFNGVDLIELGAGNGFKSYHLLKCMMENHIPFTYYPIDISTQIIQYLEQMMPERLPGLKIRGLNGEYFEMMTEIKSLSAKPKVVLFLGATIGNMTPPNAERFCLSLREQLNKGDLVLMGFDLRKNPWIIFNAYNDHGGITREFNLNLLNRINNELDGNFNLDHFEHFENYDPETGACKSYIISLADQKVRISDEQIDFEENENIFVETSQKYTLEQTDQMALKAGFKPLDHFLDSRKWFSDVIWEAV
ncbi:MAG TPA: L-histidine N(alpha)-methyltransferase [Sphingobacteriaceae bacterium]